MAVIASVPLYQILLYESSTVNMNGTMILKTGATRRFE